MKSFLVLALMLSLCTLNAYAQQAPAADSSAKPATAQASAASPAAPKAAAKPQADASAVPPKTQAGGASTEAAPPPPPPPVKLPAPQGKLTVEDTPNDDGRSLTVTWVPGPAPAELTGYRLKADYMPPPDPKKPEEPPKPAVKTVDWPAGQKQYQTQLDGLSVNLPVKVTVYPLAGEAEGEPSPPQTAIPKGNLFHTGKVNVGIAVFLFVGVLAYFIQRSRAGAALFIRKISGLDAVEDAVGRATEMGRPILYVPGLSGVSDIATIAAMNILDPVARKAAAYGTKLIVPNRDPIVYTVSREVVKGAFAQAGRPDLFREDNVFFLTDSQFGYAAGVNGIMVREKPATNFFIGMFWAESLVLTETGASTGAIQIAGCDATTQIPFFIVSCDYTLIGEELYAASAYLGRQPLLLGTIKAQDVMKVLLLVLISLGVITSMFNSTIIFNLLTAAR